MESCFFEIDRSKNLAEILGNIGFSFNGIKEIKSAAPLENATEGDLTFFALNEISGSKYVDFIKNTKASFCLIKEKDLSVLPEGIVPIISKNPFFDFVRVYSSVIKCKVYDGNSTVDETALVSKKATIGNGCKIGKNVKIGDFVVVCNGVEIGDNTTVEPFCYIGTGCKIGSDCILYPNVTVEFTEIGTNCKLRTGARIGQSGFGFIPEANNFEIPHYGSVKIGDFVDIGANACVDRGVFGKTEIESNVKIDNLVQVAHNVRICKNTMIAGQTGIAGSTKLGNGCMIGGQVGIAGHLNIGDYVIVHGFSGVTKSLRDKSRVMACWPAEDYKDWVKKVAKFNILMSKSDKIMSIIGGSIKGKGIFHKMKLFFRK